MKSPSPLTPGLLALYDEILPSFVKERFSKKAEWKSKPFSEVDARFYFRGIQELSEKFTEERGDPFQRSSKLPDYFQHEKFRSAYFLYFFPLQTSKFFALFKKHEEALLKALGRPLRLLDLGSGPGTATFAWLAWLAQLPPHIEIPKLQITWVDQNYKILKEGEALLARVLPLLPRPVSVELTISTELPSKGGSDIVLAGHFLNEGQVSESLYRRLEKLLSDARLFLAIEPASRAGGQTLSLLRDQLLEEQDFQVIGPCLHSERCPLASGRDWCHFSLPLKIAAKWFTVFSKYLGSEREWLKFSYLFLSRGDSQPRAASKLRLAVSDPMRLDGRDFQVLLCEPERVRRIKVPATKDRKPPMIKRGDVIDPEKWIRLGPSSPFGSSVPSGKGRPKMRRDK